MVNTKRPPKLLWPLKKNLNRNFWIPPTAPLTAVDLLSALIIVGRDWFTGYTLSIIELQKAD